MKKIFLAIIAFLPLSLMAQELKLAYVNANEVIMQMSETQDMQKQITDLQTMYEGEYMKLLEEGQKKMKEFEELQKTNADQAILQSRAEEIRNLEQRIEMFRTNSQEQLQKKQEELLKPIQEKVSSTINEIGIEKGFTYIFPVEVLLFKSSSAVDLTAELKKRLVK